MAQTKWWNWQDDDSTFQMNQRDLVIIPHGRYSGFEGQLGGTMDLTLTGTGGVEKVDASLNSIEIKGLWKTKQGGIVQETAAIVIPLDDGDVTNPRIDLIVGEHEYTQVVGGTTAIYKVIKGTPAATPVAPSLPVPNKQVILGRIYIPAGTTALTDPGVVYTKEPVPSIFSDADIMYRSKYQSVEGVKIFDAMLGRWESYTINTATHKITMPVRSNFGIIAASGSYGTFELIEDLDIQYTTDGESDGNTYMWHIYTNVELKITNTYGSGGRFVIPTGVCYIPAGSFFTIIDATFHDGTSNKAFIVRQGTELRTEYGGKMRKVLSYGQGTATFNSGTNTIELDGSGNYYTLDLNGITPTNINFITDLEATVYKDTHGKGTELFLEINNIVSGWNLRKLTGAPGSGTMHINWDEDGISVMQLNTGSTALLHFVDVNGSWKLINISTPDFSPATLKTAMASIPTSSFVGGGNGDIIYNNAGTWTNTNMQTLIQAMNLKMTDAIEFNSLTVTAWPITTVSGKLVWIASRANNIQILVSTGGGIGAILDAFPDSYQIGTEITINCAQDLLQINLEATGVPSNYLPFKRVRYTTNTWDTGAYIAGYRSFKIVRRQTFWEIVDIGIDLNDKANKAITWNTLSLATGWDVLGGYTTRYSKDDMGIVRLDGAVQDTAGGTTLVATLPAGYRPSNNFNILVADNFSNNSLSLSILSNGQIIANNTGGASFYLTGIQFPAV